MFEFRKILESDIYDIANPGLEREGRHRAIDMKMFDAI